MFSLERGFELFKIPSGSPIGTPAILLLKICNGFSFIAVASAVEVGGEFWWTAGVGLSLVSGPLIFAGVAHVISLRFPMRYLKYGSLQDRNLYLPYLYLHSLSIDYILDSHVLYTSSFGWSCHYQLSLFLRSWDRIWSLVHWLVP